MNLPNDVNYILNKFYENGFEAFIVGGCVRDNLIKRKPGDYDITTNALPEQIISLFDKTIPTGIKHGTITVMVNNVPYEVTTYRIDGEYLDNRKPEDVVFVSNIQEDLSRRDFTINALAYSTQLGFKDFFNGEEDLKNKIIRCVGDPDKRFNEDALRMLRAIRFSCQLNFKIDKDTLDSIKKNHKLICNISIERIRDEFTKILLSDNASNGLTLLREIGIIRNIVPALDGIREVNSYDIYDDIHDKFTIVDMTPKKLHIRLAALFYNLHNCEITENFCELVLKTLKYDNSTISDTCHLVREVCHIPTLPNKVQLKKLINRTSKTLIFDLFALEKAYINFKDEYSTEHVELLESLVEEILENNEPLTVKDLYVDGKTLIKELDLKPGKDIGLILEKLLDYVLKNPSANDRDTLLELAKDFIQPV